MLSVIVEIVTAGGGQLVATRSRALELSLDDPCLVPVFCHFSRIYVIQKFEDYLIFLRTKATLHPVGRDS